MTVANPLDQMIERPDATRGDHRNAQPIRDSARQRNIETRLGSVPIHRSQQDLPSAVIRKTASPCDRVDAGRPAAAMGEDLPMSRRHDLGVDRSDDTLAAEFLGGFAHEFGAGDGCRVDRHLVRAGQQQAADILDRAHAAANGERHETLLGGTADDIVQRVAIFNAGRDIEKTQLVGAFAIVEPRLRDRIAGVDEIDEIDPFDDPPVLDVETRNDPHLQHCGCSANARNAAPGSIRPS